MTYWLVNSGTTEEPWHDRLAQRYTAWVDEHGDVQMFDRRYGMRRGDVLIHRAVGLKGSPLVAVGEVLSGPAPSGHKRWPFQVRRRITHIVPSPEDAPLLAEIGERPVRVTKRLDDRVGRLAERLIRERGAG